MNYPYSAYSLIAIPIVFLFVWLFNAYRLGKFRKGKSSAASTGTRRNPRHQTWIACGLVLVLILLVIGVVAALEK